MAKIVFIFKKKKKKKMLVSLQFVQQFVDKNAPEKWQEQNILNADGPNIKEQFIVSDLYRRFSINGCNASIRKKSLLSERF